MQDQQYLRKLSLLLVDGDKALDLTQMHFKFQTSNQDAESPSTAVIRVYNLSDTTIKKIRGEFSHVVLQAGYQDAAFGVIFDGTIKQYRIGKENGTDSYLDIMAADGDLGYNFSTISQTLAAGTSSLERTQAAIAAMAPQGIKQGQLLIPTTGGVLPRGKVLFGLARASLRQETAAIGSTWTISQGNVQVVPLTGYLPSQAVVLNAQTGLIGRVDQTEDGMRCRCLLNPKIVVGGLVQIDNKSINKTVAARDAEVVGSQLAYNRYAGIQQFASESADGLYRVYVAEHNGDTRGNDFYSDLICLSIDPVTKTCRAF